MKYCTFPKEVYLAAFSRSSWACLFMASRSGRCSFVIGFDITGSGTLGFLQGMGWKQKSWSRNWVWGLGGDWCLVTAGGTDSRWREVQDEEQKPERLFHVRIFPHVYVLPALNKNSTIKTCHFDPKWKILLKNWMMGFGLQHDSSKEKTTCWDQGFNAAHRYIYKWPCMVWCSRV